MKKSKLIVYGIIFGFFLFFIIPLSVVQIDSGVVGVKLRNGKLVGTVGEGLKFKLPFLERVVKFEVRTQKEQVNADSASKDLQQIDATVALNYRIDREKVGEIYRELGTSYKDRIISPRLQEAVKSVTAKFTAEELITKRSEVKEQIFIELKKKLTPSYIIVEDVNIVNFGFSPEFNKAIEQKQLAEQNAKKAENDLKRIEIEGQQQITKAKAEAEAQRLQQLTLNELLLQKQFLEKWDGRMPLVVGSDANILDLQSLINKSQTK